MSKRKDWEGDTRSQEPSFCACFDRLSKKNTKEGHFKKKEKRKGDSAKETAAKGKWGLNGVRKSCALSPSLCVDRSAKMRRASSGRLGRIYKALLLPLRRPHVTGDPVPHMNTRPCKCSYMTGITG